MNDWKEAFWLAKFELKKLKLGFVLLALMAIMFSMFFATVIPKNMERSTVMLDIFFFIVFGFGTAWIKPKEFNHQKIGGDFWASPFFITLRQLPIQKDVLIKSRFIIFFAFAVPYYLGVSILTYAFSPDLRAALDLKEYFAFIMIWIGIGIHLGASFPASDVGYRLSTVRFALYIFALFFGFMFIFTIFNILYGNGFVPLTMLIAEKWPLVSIIASVFFAAIGVLYSQKYMSKKIEKMDYLF
ncbi:hypothetical protein NST97_02050 [Aeribacillus sp. FSL K6-1305]|uniref:hypothetical protein n=1 Tax=Aeribacillus sp. FSL K6-1305 TaxID=2954569 RepID=UPI0030FDA72E